MAIFVPVFFFLVLPILALVFMDRAVENDPRGQDADIDGKKPKQGDVEANPIRTDNEMMEVQHHSYEGKDSADAISEHGAGKLVDELPRYIKPKGKEVMEDNIELNQTRTSYAKTKEHHDSYEVSTRGIKGGGDLEAGQQSKAAVTNTNHQNHSYAESTSEGKASTDIPSMPRLNSESHLVTVPPFFPPLNRNQTADEAKKAALKFAYWVTGLSFAGLIGLLSGIFGDKRGLTHELLFKACTSCTVATMFFGLALMLLAFINSTPNHLVIILKVIKYIALGFLASAATLLASIILLQNFK